MAYENFASISPFMEKNYSGQISLEKFRTATVEVQSRKTHQKGKESMGKKTKDFKKNPVFEAAVLGYIARKNYKKAGIVDPTPSLPNANLADHHQLTLSLQSRM